MITISQHWARAPHAVALYPCVLPIPVSELKLRQVEDDPDLSVSVEQNKHWVRNAEIFDGSGMLVSRLSNRG